MNPLCLLSATELARRIRERRVTATEAVEAHVARIREVNPALNAVVAERFEAARAEARRADERTRTEPPEALPPLHGVPCTIKECFALRGMPNTGGLRSRRGRLATRDATGVARLRAAGAIPLGVTNVSELCMWMESNNCVYGRTNNPYDHARIVGGSSGGEGAIIAAGGSPFGLGSDVGGSIRMPAFFNGVFGHKPSGGLVPGSGQFPNAHGRALRYLTTGPLCRRAEDLWPLVRLLAGPDGDDAGCSAIPLGDPAAVRVADLTVVTVRGNGVVAVAPELVVAQQRAAAALAAAGARVVERDVARLRRSFDIYSAMLHGAGGPSFASMMGEGVPVSPALELARWLVGRSEHTLPAIVLAGMQAVADLMPARMAAASEEGRRLRAELHDLIGPAGVMLYPSYPEPAPRHNWPLLAPYKWIYTAILNVMELPSTQVPLGLSAAGLPLGVQVVGRHGNDHVTVAAALELERRLGGWVPPRLPASA
jgi:fatty acid amide hydrolase 2